MGFSSFLSSIGDSITSAVSAVIPIAQSVLGSTSAVSPLGTALSTIFAPPPAGGQRMAQSIPSTGKLFGIPVMFLVIGGVVLLVAFLLFM